ncbi:MAG: prephenate dehydrogenase [Candidatus Binatia bacterium]
MTVLVDRMLVAGVGLIGGSLALAAREAGLVREVIGFGRTQANLDMALRRGLIDRVATDERVAGEADLIVLAAPVEACARLAARFRSVARADTTLTDVGSVKESLVAALETTWPDAGHVVGAHPIAGSERAGAAAARADLFRGQLCILTPTARTDTRALALVRALWEGVGARIEEMPAATHDAILARVSHLPHLIAYALLGAVAGHAEQGRAVLDYVGGGFLDTTRIAASPAEVWRDIALANRAAIATSLAEFRAALDGLEHAISSGDAAGLERMLAAAATVRRRLGAGT